MNDPILYLRTSYDDKDLLSVLEIYSYDDDGEEVIHEEATNECMGLGTCADAGHLFLMDKVIETLAASTIAHSGVECEEDYGSKEY